MLANKKAVLQHGLSRAFGTPYHMDRRNILDET